MYSTFLAVDTGYSYVKYAYKTIDPATGEVITPLKKGKFIAAIAPLDEVAGYGVGDSKAVEYNGDRYLVGKDALLSRSVLPTRGDDFLVKYSPLMIHEIIKREGVNPNLLVVSLSIAEYAKKRNELKESCSNFQVGDKIYAFDVEVLPQGIGIWEYAGRPESAMIIDIGFNTIDIVTILDGRPAGEYSMGFKDMGVCEITNAISSYINSKFPGYFVPEIALVKIVKDGQLRINRKNYDIRDVIEKKRKGYTERIFTTIKTSPKLSTIFDSVDQVIVAGGGAYFIDEDLKEEFRFTVLDEPEFANVLGFLKKVEASYAK